MISKKQNKKDLILTPTEKQILLGTLLGDGSIGIQPKGKTARFQMRHSIVQKEWFYWKAEQLSRLASDNAIHISEPDGYSTNKKIHFQTLSIPALNEINNLVKKDGVKTVSDDWLNQIDPLALTVWWLDDGGLVGGGRQGRWNTQGFEEEGSIILSNFLKQKYGIENTVASYIDKSNGKTYYNLSIQTNALKRLFRIMLPHVPCSSMLYKFFVVHENREKQQHWITEMKEILVKDSLNTGVDKSDFLEIINNFEKERFSK